MLKNINTIFFDYDGTLHNSIKIYAPAFRKAYKFLASKGYTNEREYTDKEISYWLGFSSKNMWKNFMPDLNEKVRDEASKLIGIEMINQLSKGNAELYDDSIEVLKYLKNKGYKLIFISNCSINYMEAHSNKFNLNDYFSKMVCSEQYDYIPKYEILKNIKSNYERDMVIVGDRIQDIEAGTKNNILTIGCNYGYGDDLELKDADYIINNIKEIMELL